MNTVILFDFGSTFTKATVVSLNEKKVIFTTKTPSTVNTNAKHGLDKCCEDIKKIIGESELAKARKFDQQRFGRVKDDCHRPYT